MKKYIIGFIAGALFATAGAVYADEVVLIGKQIQGQTAVYKDGERLDSAIIVDGKSYAPTRAIGEAAGYEVKFDEGEIFLVSPVEEVKPQPNGGEIVTQPEANPRTLEQVNYQITRTTMDIEAYKSGIHSKEIHLAANPEYEGRDLHVSEVERYKKELAEAEDRLADLEAEKAALEAQQ